MNRSCRALLLACVVFGCADLSGCRAIRGLGESRQSISARRLSGRGFEAMHDGRWDDAENLFAEALRVSKADDRAHYGLSESFWKGNQRERAIAHMQQAVRLSAGDPRFVRRLGRMHLDMGNLAGANEHSLWALRSDRDSAEAWSLRGDCLVAAGQLDEALAAYHRALAHQPDFPTVQLQAAEVYYAQGRFDRLLATLDRLQDDVGVDATIPRVDHLQSIALRNLGRPTEARYCLERAISKDPDDAQLHLQLAALARELGDETLAENATLVARGLQAKLR